MNAFAIVAKKKSAAAPAGPIFSRILTIDHTKVPSTQTDFPVLVSLTNAKLKTVANGGHVQRSDGFDIGFYSDEALTTLLSWEMESFNGTTGTVVAWVKLPSVQSSSDDTVFYISYGDASITTDHSDPVNVWSNNFLAVYHLGDGTTLSLADSKGVHNGTNNNAVTATTTAKIGGAADYVFASAQSISCGNTINPAAVTYSAWARALSYSSAYQPPVARSNGSVFSGLWLHSGSPFVAKMSPTFTATGGLVNYDNTGVTTLSINTFYHLVATYNSSAGCVGYVNGAVDGTATANGTLVTTAINTSIGADPAGASNWAGQLDEVRVASVARSADWILTEYNNQNNPGTFMTLGPE